MYKHIKGYLKGTTGYLSQISKHVEVEHFLNSRIPDIIDEMVDPHFKRYLSDLFSPTERHGNIIINERGVKADSLSNTIRGHLQSLERTCEHLQVGNKARIGGMGWLLFPLIRVVKHKIALSLLQIFSYPHLFAGRQAPSRQLLHFV